VSDSAQTVGASSKSGSPFADPITGRFEVRATASDHFSWLRTRASVQRTLMSWIRTAVSLIGFGFTIVQFFERMQELPRVNPALHPAAPRYLGLALIARGILALVVSIWQYHWTMRKFRTDRGDDKGGNTNTALCGRARPYRDRRLCLRCRAVAFRVAPRVVGLPAALSF
jgi:uncharacterized membrane protein YidH (DUF202 family)